jgi:Coenzyme F390 synthetase
MSFGGLCRRELYWTIDFFRGSKVHRHFHELQVVLGDSEIGKKIQRKRLRELLEHVTTYSLYYKDYKGRKIDDFPVVNKAILNENHDAVKIDAENIPEQETKEVHVQKTSGSTGTPFAVFQDSRKRYRRIAELKYFGEDVGFKSHEKLGQCRIWTKWQNKSKWQSFKENIIPINVAKCDDATLQNICETVKKNKVVSMRAYASWYDQLADYLETGKADPRDFKTVKVAISSSEALNETTREKMMRLAGVPIVECYADEEAGILAQQKLNDTNYYLNHASYYFEILKLESDEPAEYGELGRIVITDLYNYAFPLIRYDTGDTAIMVKGNDKSHGWDYISKLYGRRLDLIYDTQGNPTHPMNFARVLKNIQGIVQWQFIQKDEKEYILKLNYNERIDLDNVIKEIKNIVGADASVMCERVDDIPVLASGKRKPVICEWEKNK